MVVDRFARCGGTIDVHNDSIGFILTDESVGDLVEFIAETIVRHWKSYLYCSVKLHYVKVKLEGMNNDHSDLKSSKIKHCLVK